MEKILLALIFSICTISLIVPISAQTAVFTEDAGQTPASGWPFYNIDLWLDEIRINMASSDEQRNEIAFSVAEERLLELRQMLMDGNIPGAETARANHDKMLNIINSNAKKQTDNPESEIIDEISIEKRLELHNTKVNAIHEGIISRIQGNIDNLADKLPESQATSILERIDIAMDIVEANLSKERERLITDIAQSKNIDVSQVSLGINQIENNVKDRLTTEIAERIESKGESLKMRQIQARP